MTSSRKKGLESTVDNKIMELKSSVLTQSSGFPINFYAYWRFAAESRYFSGWYRTFLPRFMYLLHLAIYCVPFRPFIMLIVHRYINSTFSDFKPDGKFKFATFLPPFSGNSELAVHYQDHQWILLFYWWFRWYLIGNDRSW